MDLRRPCFLKVGECLVLPRSDVKKVRDGRGEGLGVRSAERCEKLEEAKMVAALWSGRGD